MHLHIRRIFFVVFFGLVIGLAFGWLAYQRKTCNPLVKYGVSYEITYGEHEEYQCFHLIWKRDKEEIDGPLLWGDNLDVKFLYANDDSIPEIIVRSDDEKNDVAIFRLNFNDKSKPEFELIECHGFFAQYPPPLEQIL